MKFPELAGMLLTGSLLFFGMNTHVHAQNELSPQVKQKIQQCLASCADRFGTVGQSVAILKNGKLIYTGTHGLASVELDVKITEETVFQLFSISKLFTITTLMQLVEAGKISLDAPIGQYLEQLPETWKPITTRQLLTHVSGLPEYFMVVVPTPKTQEEGLAAVLQKPFEFKTGSKNSYNQTNYLLIKMIMEKVSGEEYESLVTAQSFKKFNMNSTRYGGEWAVVPGRAITYAPSETGLVKNGPIDQPDYMMTATGLNSNVPDLISWLTAFLDGQLISKETIKAMWQPALLNDGSKGQFVNGWERSTTDGVTRVGHGGGNRLDVRHFMKENSPDTYSVIYLTNGGAKWSQPRDMTDALANIASGDSLFPLLTLSEQMFDHITAGSWPKALAQYEAYKKANPNASSTEDSLNALGYKLLLSLGAAKAMPVFQLNVNEHPKSANPYDSLGEAYLAVGEKKKALEYYSKAYEMAPNANLRKVLDGLKR